MDYVQTNHIQAYDFLSNFDEDPCTKFLLPKYIYIQSGAGIVADSDSRSEFKETENKAMALLQAVIYSKNFEN